MGVQVSESPFSILLGIYLGLKLLGHTVILGLIFEGTAKLSFAVTFYISFHLHSLFSP